MQTPVLVTYASRYGSTQEVAERIAAVLREHGLAVNLQSAAQVKALDGYGAVVIGAPLYMGRWHKDARSFLDHHQAALEQRPVALFTLGPTQPSEQDWTNVRVQLDQQMATVPWLKPVASVLFGGKFDPAKLRFPFSLLTKLPGTPLHAMAASDIRDWDAMCAWANDLAAQLQPVPAR